MTTENSQKFRITASDAGYFKKYFNNVKNLITENQLKEFDLIKTDEERVRFVQKLLPENFKFPIEITEAKSFETAKDFKQKGNKEFGKNDNKAALDFYSKSILATPYTEEHISDLAITLANRSAALYHLQEYESALNDIKLVLELPYPKELRYKVTERKARCLLALNKHKEALQEFRNTLQALDDSKLPTEKKLKMQTDIQIMLGILTKPKTKGGHINAFVESSKNKKDAKSDEEKNKLCSARNKIYEAGCDKFDVLENEELGRYVSAVSDIQAGDAILVEKPFCTAILQEHSLTHCTNCFKRTNVPYPCKTCEKVIFCSPECRIKAENSYHKYECKILNSLYKSGASVMVLMALRMVTEKSPKFFLDIKDKLQEKPQFKKYKSSDYLAAYNLVRHEEQRQRSDFFERTVMSLFLLQCLKKSDYFQSDEGKITDEEYFITSLILRHLQLLQFNAHEIFELEVASNGKIDDSQTIFIGGGLFPTLALFNHSCNPDTTRYFDGTTVVMRTTKPVRPGDMISENYGPLFTSMNKKNRQKVLKSQFWFDCSCIACAEDWPTFHEMNKSILRFRCDARRDDGGKFSICDNAVAVPVDTQEFMVRCLLCGQATNIFKGLKALQDTDALFKQATRDMGKGNYKAALAIYIEIITLLDSVMKPPFQDFTLCQQAIRKCMLTFGNKYVKKE